MRHREMDSEAFFKLDGCSIFQLDSCPAWRGKKFFQNKLRARMLLARSYRMGLDLYGAMVWFLSKFEMDKPF